MNAGVLKMIFRNVSCCAVTSVPHVITEKLLLMSRLSHKSNVHCGSHSSFAFYSLHSALQEQWHLCHIHRNIRPLHCDELLLSALTQVPPYRLTLIHLCVNE